MIVNFKRARRKVNGFSDSTGEDAARPAYILSHRIKVS